MIVMNSKPLLFSNFGILILNEMNYYPRLIRFNAKNFYCVNLDCHANAKLIDAVEKGRNKRL